MYNIIVYLFPDKNLKPFTQYRYELTVSNGAGSAKSSQVTATTLQSRPEGLKPPQATVRPQKLDTVYLEWQPPQLPNGNYMY